jgi:hypothetical protein
MSYPGPKVHRVNRRKLGRGQYPAPTAVTCTVTGSVDTATLTFSRPVVVTGPIPFTVATLTVVSQTIISPTVVQILMSGALSTNAYNLPSNAANVSTYQGGGVAGVSGAF